MKLFYLGTVYTGKTLILKRKMKNIRVSNVIVAKSREEAEEIFALRGEYDLINENVGRITSGFMHGEKTIKINSSKSAIFEDCEHYGLSELRQKLTEHDFFRYTEYLSISNKLFNRMLLDR